MADEWGEPVAGTSSAHDFETDPVLVGTFRGTDTVRVQHMDGERDSRIHRFLDDDSRPVDAWGTADLDRKLAACPPGTRCRIQYLGRKQLDNGREIKLFEVRTAKSEPGHSVAVPPANEPDEDIPF